MIQVDFDEIKQNLERLEHDCKGSWDYLRIIAKHESTHLHNKVSDFLTDCAQRILALKTIYRRVINRLISDYWGHVMLNIYIV